MDTLHPGVVNGSITPGPGTSLKGKVALITGASSGIGASVARYFASLGCRLALTGRNLDNLQEVVEECIERGLERDQILPIQANFEVESDVKKTADQTIQKFKQLDVLVNNAGTASLDSIETLKLETFDTIFAVNVRAPLYLTHLLAPHLIASKGTVVNNSSLYGIRPMPSMTSYSLSKKSLDHMTRCIAEELAPYGVRVNAVNPGVIPTRILERMGVTDEAVQKTMFEFCKKTHAMRRTGTVDEIAKVVAFLASSDSSFTTGETLLADGGSHLLVTTVD
ncbi:tropinone reductase-like 3 [Lytechinus variegatus]|uniref:tropinone reductase-like 3 n=1 Tax=Lytechinus variegatus TaxID=7654 RepID=UPI001BB0E0A6|nr:tropinone reductase-like 3 [Lytechinus variegatus]